MIEKKMNLKYTTTTCRKPLILLGLLHFCRLLQKGYANGADIVENGSLDTGMVLTGMLFAVIGILTAYWKYSRKDIQA